MPAALLDALAKACGFFVWLTRKARGVMLSRREKELLGSFVAVRCGQLPLIGGRPGILIACDDYGNFQSTDCDPILVSEYLVAVERLRKRGLLVDENDYLRLTKTGRQKAYKMAGRGYRTAMRYVRGG